MDHLYALLDDQDTWQLDRNLYSLDVNGYLVNNSNGKIAVVTGRNMWYGVDKFLDGELAFLIVFRRHCYKHIHDFCKLYEKICQKYKIKHSCSSVWEIKRGYCDDIEELSVTFLNRGDSFTIYPDSNEYGLVVRNDLIRVNPLVYTIKQ